MLSMRRDCHSASWSLPLPGLPLGELELADPGYRDAKSSSLMISVRQAGRALRK